MKVGDNVVRDHGLKGKIVAMSALTVAVETNDYIVTFGVETGKQIGATMTWELAPRTVRCRFWAWDNEPDRVIITDSDIDDDPPWEAHWIGEAFDLEVPEVMK